MNKTELNEVLKEHKKWLAGEGGQGAYLRDAYLQYADLQDAYLQDADLQRAYLQYADLQRADLQRANLQGADLQGADLQGADLKNTILEDINWLAYIGIVPDKRGLAYAYKIITLKGEGIYNGGINYIKETQFEVNEVDTDLNQQCSYGINLATFSWCLNQFTNKSYRLFMFRFNARDAICPIGSDGKFRVLKCTKVGECDWKGNLLKGKRKNESHND